jgi:hypothetical protein
MPKRRIHSDPAAFRELETLVKQHEASGRTKSAAFLIWFLQTIYRLDETDAQDAVCDKREDMGIDAVTVNDDSEEIVLFQAKRKEKLPTTLGDSDLKSFVGALTQFKDKESIEKLIEATDNTELKNLLSTNEVAEKIGRGYVLRAIFIANVAADASAVRYMQTAQKTGAIVELWDLQRIGSVLKQLSKDWFVDQRIKLKIVPGKCFVDGPKGNPHLVFASISARQLVKLPGIDDTRVFAQNVRLGLGRTRVNKEILASVKSKEEHPKFLTFHNGLTMVAQQLKLRGSTLTLNKYSVCNGCRSLLTFYDNRRVVSEELEVLVRIVRVSEKRETAESIAYRTNNQNAISLRDLSANDATQIQIKAEFDEFFGDRVTYVIKRGEATDKSELQNEDAGQLLLASYTRQPWSAHQKYKIFGDLKSQIFSYGITACHIRLAQLIADQVFELIGSVNNERVRKYSLTKFILIYLIGELLRVEADGEKLLQNPEPFLELDGVKNSAAVEQKVLRKIKELTNFAITELNYFVEEKGGDAYDYKSEFKSEKQVASIRKEVMKAYDKDKFRKRITPFALPK